MAPQENGATEVTALKVDEVELTSQNTAPPTSEDRKLIQDFYQSFEYTMVFPMIMEDGSDFDPKDPDSAVQSNEAKYVINTMLHVGFKVYTFLSVQKDELYVLFTAPQSILGSFADAINFKLPLDGEYCKNKLAVGMPEKRIKPIKIADETRFSFLHPFDDLYGKYDTQADQNIYLCDSKSSEKSSGHGNATGRCKNSAGVTVNVGDDLFTGLHKLKLMYTMLVASRRHGGCKLDIQGMLVRKEILALYPSHNQDHIDDLIRVSTSHFLTWPWNLPYNRLRNYLGEKFALIFVFLGFQSWWLIVPVILGFICQITIWSTGT
jgi:hypothetical protein